MYNRYRSQGRPDYNSPLPHKPVGSPAGVSENSTEEEKIIKGAVDAIVSQDDEIFGDWIKSGHNTEKPLEHLGIIVDRAKSGVLVIGRKTGKKDEVTFSLKGGEIRKTDKVLGVYHTHPYPSNEVENARALDGWDLRGTTPSGGDFRAMAAEVLDWPDDKPVGGLFAVVEGGSECHVIVVTNLPNYLHNFWNPKSRLANPNFIDSQIKKAFEEWKNTVGERPHLSDLEEKVLVNTLEKELRVAVKTSNKSQDNGFVLMKAKRGDDPLKASDFIKIYPT
jgi:hypothetical protein